MKYLIIGSGGTGSSIGGFLASEGKDVTFISRGKNLEVMKEKGLLLKSTLKGEMKITNAKFVSEANYDETADVIFVCVKGYSVEDIVPIVKKAASEKTIIIPIMNGYSMGSSIAAHIEKGVAIEGCIYISAFIEEAGVAVQLGKLFKVVFGPKKGQDVDQKRLEAIKEDLSEAGIVTIVSENIERDTFKKFSFISSYAACGAYYDCTADAMQKDEAIHSTFVKLGQEIESIGKALGMTFDSDLVAANIDILNSLTPDTTASMQKDMAAGKKSEIDGLVFRIVRLAKELGLSVAVYEKISEHFGYSK